MKLRAFALLLMLAGAALAGPPIALKVTAAETSVVITKLPARVTAPAADLYEWSYPSTFKADQKANVLVITEATDGTFVVSCTTYTARAGVVVRSRGNVTIIVDVETPAPAPAVVPVPLPAVTPPAKAPAPAARKTMPPTETALLREAEDYIARHRRR